MSIFARSFTVFGPTPPSEVSSEKSGKRTSGRLMLGGYSPIPRAFTTERAAAVRAIAYDGPRGWRVRG